MTGHEIWIGLHWHEDQCSGMEIACSCGDMLHTECDTEALLSLDELQEIAGRHQE